jgi:hypothetical protein
MDDRDLLERVQRLEAVEAIRNLVHTYARLCDDGYDADGLAELFTDDAHWSAVSADGTVGYGEYHSKEEIRSFFAGVSATLGPMTLHYVLAPEVEVAPGGESATGHCYLLTAATMTTEASPEGEAVLIGATAQHEYRKLDGRWRFSRLVTTLDFQSRLTRGWVDEPFVS